MTQPSTNGSTPASSGRTPTQGNRLDPWYDVYADRAHNLRASEIRALFSVVSRPEVVSLAGGMPNLKDLPLERLAASAEKLIRNHGAQAMQYGSGQGWEVLRERITEVMAYDGIVGADPDDVVVTTGSQQALDLVTELFVNPGDVILAEAPSYVGALGVFRARQADIVHVPMDENGIIPEALVETIRDVRASGRTIKFIYIIPNYHNPAGVTLSAKRRPIIAEICLREHVLIVEDNPYGLLGFHNDPLPAIASYSPEGVVYLGSFSKMFAPGFRIGWAYAPHAIRAKLVLALESAILCPSMVGQMAIADYLSNYDWYGQVKSFRSMYAERCRAMLHLARGVHAIVHVDGPRRRLLHVGDAARGPRREGHAAACRTRPGRVRVGNGVLLRWLGLQPHAPVLLLPHSRGDPRGRAPPFDGRQRGEGNRRHVRYGFGQRGRGRVRPLRIT